MGSSVVSSISEPPRAEPKTLRQKLAGLEEQGFIVKSSRNRSYDFHVEYYGHLSDQQIAAILEENGIHARYAGSPKGAGGPVFEFHYQGQQKKAVIQSH